MRASRRFLFITVVCAASGAGASTSQGADGVPYQRIITIGDGMSMYVGPVLTALPPDQRYRFVSPDSLAMGIGADDVSSTQLQWCIDEPAEYTELSADLLEMLLAGERG